MKQSTYKRRTNKPMPYKIAFFDMDGTLYQTENDIIQESSLKALRKLREQGILVCVATGRPLNQMKLILERVDFDYMVLINGGFVLDKNYNKLFDNPIDNSTLQDIVSWCEQQKNGLMFHFNNASYIYDKFYPLYDFCRDHHVLDSLFYDETRSYHNHHCAYNSVIMTKDQKSLEEFLVQHEMLRSDLIEVAQDHFCFDVFNANNDKFVGIHQVLQKENISWNECICFGDSTNDTKMLEMAGLGVAMGNASDYVKSFADEVTTSVYDNGIANALDKFVFNR